MNWQEFFKATPKVPDNPTLEQWREAVAEAQRMIDTEVVESDRAMAQTILGDTLIQWGAFWGFIEPAVGDDHDDVTDEDAIPNDDAIPEGEARMTDPEGEGLADDLIGDDPIPDDARRFDERGYPIAKPMPKPESRK